MEVFLWDMLQIKQAPECVYFTEEYLYTEERINYYKSLYGNKD